MQFKHIQDFRVVKADPEDMTKIVVDKIAEGWQPFGPPTFIADGSTAMGYATLVKYKKDVTPVVELGVSPDVSGHRLDATLISPWNPMFHSQAGQDRFVHALLVKGGAEVPLCPDNGASRQKRPTRTFLDVGCNHPVTINNTYALEQLGWRGLLIDLKTHGDYSALRQSPMFVGDATNFNWEQWLYLHQIPKTVDYLSLDVDEATVGALENLLKHGVRWRVATIEHDSYAVGLGPRKRIRELMAQEGYTMVCGDVKLNGLAFEDWWVDAKLVQGWEKFQCVGWPWEAILEKVKDAVERVPTKQQ